ncbi:unnamed protein product [Orchesella dallaii]|uniref:BTB domain-containing protein n=1 Tax=Orchesella dallaii TaxID=48710 RepID=A0ABP1QNZ6_9HEXA
MASNPVTTEYFYRIAWKVLRPSLISSFAQYFQDQLFTDMTISCEGERIQCHRILLAACSPVFEEMLKRIDATGTPSVIEGFEFSQIKQVLEFMYMGKVDVRPEDLAEFIRAAKMLQVKGLLADDHDEDDAMSTSSSGYAAEMESDEASSPNEKRMTSEQYRASRTPSRKIYINLKMPTDNIGVPLPAEAVPYRQRSYRYKNYSKENVESATRAIRNGMSVAVAARDYRIPSRTLYQRIRKLGIKPVSRRKLLGKGDCSSTSANSSVADEQNA